MFAVDSEVHYECEDGFTVGADTKKSIICMDGNWTIGNVEICSNENALY